MDFLTLVYNNNSEIQLLKLQALSFKFVQESLVNNIIIFYNDNGRLNVEKSLIKSYPLKFRNKVKIIYRDDLNIDYNKSDWKIQQFFKLFRPNK